MLIGPLIHDGTCSPCSECFMLFDPFVIWRARHVRAMGGVRSHPPSQSRVVQAAREGDLFGSLSDDCFRLVCPLHVTARKQMPCPTCTHGHAHASRLRLRLRFSASASASASLTMQPRRSLPWADHPVGGPTGGRRRRRHRLGRRRDDVRGLRSAGVGGGSSCAWVAGVAVCS